MVCLVALAAGAVPACWLLAAYSGELPAVVALVAGVEFAVLVVAASLLRRVHGVLRFDGTTWHWAPRNAATAGGESVAGRLEVHLDIASFMLLRFVPETTGRKGSGTVWIPVGAGSAAGGWHAFRCAAYAPRTIAAPLGVVSDGSS